MNMRTKIVGVTFCNDDGSSRAKIIAGMTDSDKICIERDPYNPYDSDAVKVCDMKNGEKKQIGFLAKEIAAEISPKLRKDIKFSVSIVGVGMWHERPFCEIEITEMASTAENTTDSSGSSFTHHITGPIFIPNKRR